MKRAVLKRERTGEWFIWFVVEADEPDKPDPETLDAENCVGIDLGILSYIHTSDDLSVDCLNLTNSYDRYARAQRSLDKKEHGSARWNKQRRKVAEAKRRIKRPVLDFQHKLSNWLIETYDAVFVEDLEVKPMLETPQSAKNKQDAAWSGSSTYSDTKQNPSIHVEDVDARGTTKECNQCGIESRKPIWVREHSCPACSYEADRDYNAAKNVLDRGLQKLGTTVHVWPGRSESTPVQTALPTVTDGGSGEGRYSTVSVDAKRVVEAGSPGYGDPG